MESPLQDDPYLSLGVGKNASGAEIKSAYRKLALRCHPDKVTDDNLKQQKADEFHKIQQAYEILQDDEKRSRYDARARLAELKAEMLRRDGARGGTGGSFDSSRPRRPPMPTSFGGSFKAGPFQAHFEVRAPKFATAEDYVPEPRSASRKHSDGGAYVRRTTSDSTRTDKERRSERDEKERSARRRAREGDIRDQRDRKYHSSSSAEDVAADRLHFEEERKRRDDVVKQREEEMRRAHARRYDPLYSSDAMPPPPPGAPVFDIPKYSSQADEARRYQESANYSTSSSRPQPVRTSSSSRYYVGGSGGESRRSRASGTRRSPELVERPSLHKSATSMGGSHRDILRERVGEGAVPGSRLAAGRSYSHDITAEMKGATSGAPAMPPPPRRADTMPTVHSLNKEPSTSRPSRGGSKLRPEITPIDSGYSSSSPISPIDRAAQHAQGHPPLPTRTTSTSYRYGDGTGLTASPDKYTSSTNFPDVARPRGGSVDLHIPRPPMGGSARTAPGPPPLSSSRGEPEGVRRSSYSYERERDRHVSSSSSRRDRDRGDRSDRDRDRERERAMYYGEIPSDFTKKAGMVPPSSYERSASYRSGGGGDGGSRRPSISRSGGSFRGTPPLSRNNSIPVYS